MQGLTLSDLITQITGAVTSVVSADILALFIAAGAVISAAAMLVRRFIRAGR